MAIQENSRVRVIRGLHEGKTGKVNRIYNDLSVAIVSFDDTGDVGKVGLSSMVEILAEEKTEPKIEFMPEGAKKIYRSDFDEMIAEVTTPKKGSITDMLRNISTVIVGYKIADIIFKDADVVVMTEDQLIVEIWDGCNPNRVSKDINGEMSVVKCLTVSAAALPVLLEIVPMIFDGSEDR